MIGHSLERTSPKGTRFVGTCRLCGQEHLTTADMNDECPNQRGLSQDEALIEAIEGPREHVGEQKVLTVDEWRGVADFLFGLLDEIDTDGDRATNDALYRELVEKHHRKRFEVGATDGYRVIFQPR